MIIPNKYNVVIGDILVVPFGQRLERLPITRADDEGILASNGDYATGTSYEEAVVGKKDGRFFIGKNAKDRLNGEGFGGLRLV